MLSPCGGPLLLIIVCLSFELFLEGGQSPPSAGIPPGFLPILHSSDPWPLYGGGFTSSIQGPGLHNLFMRAGKTSLGRSPSWVPALIAYVLMPLQEEGTISVPPPAGALLYCLF